MKRLGNRILSLLLVSIILTGLVVQGVMAVDEQKLYVSNAGDDRGSGGTDVPYATVAAAYAAAPDGGTIALLDDLEIEVPLIFDEAKSITITGGSITYTGSDNISTDGGVLNVKAGAVTLRDLTLQMPAQRGTNGRPLYVGPNGSVTLGAGAVLSDGYLAYGGGNALVEGVLTMEAGASIQNAYIVNNTTCYGGGVLVAPGGEFGMLGGSIEDNTISTTQGFDSFGGGIAVMDGAAFHMEGGVIQGNSTDTNAGGVYLATGGTMTLAGDVTITGNEAGGVVDNLFLTDGAVASVAGAVAGVVGVTCEAATYGVVVGTPDGYTIREQDEDSFEYDGGEYDVRLSDGDLILFWFTVNVDWNINGAASENKADETIVDQDYDTVLTPEPGYQLPEDITVSVGGVDLDSGEYEYDPDTGVLHIPGEAVSGDITITVNADARSTITVTATHTTADVEELIVTQQDTTVITFTSAPRYGLPATVTVEGPCRHAYDPASGKLTISNVTGDVRVSAQGAEVYHTIYFDPGAGACNAPSKQLAESEHTYGTLPTPTLTGYTFSGWLAGDVLVTEATVNHLVDDLYLTARWTARTDVHYELQQWIEYTASGENPGYGGGKLTGMTSGGVTRQYYLYRTDAYDNGTADGFTSILPLALESLTGALSLDGFTPSAANQYEVMMAADGSSIFPLYYDRNVYRVDYDPNGGTLLGSTYTEIPYGSSYGVLPSAERVGYSFVGWFTGAHGGTQVRSGDANTVATSQTLYAHWQPVGSTKYTVYHLAQKLLDNSVSYDKVPDNYELTHTDTLSGTSDTDVDIYAMAMPGFTASPENSYTVTIKADGTAVAYLYYDRLITDVSYDSQGGSTVTSGSRLYYGGTFASLPAAPAKVGHHFLGWYTAPDPTAQMVVVGSAINDINSRGLTALTLYARWAPNTYELVFEAHGGILSGGKAVTYGEAVGELPTADLTGYTFIAWYDANGQLGRPEGSKTTPDTVVDATTLIEVRPDGTERVKTLYAWYDPVAVTLTFDPAPGSLAGETTLTATYDKALGTLPAPSRTGYTFEAWHLESTTGPAITAKTVSKLLGDTTAYASYTPNLYEVSFDVAGGEVLAVGKSIVTFDAPYGTLPTPQRTGYHFAGWFNAAGGEVKADTVVAITSSEILTARWTPMTFTVTFDVNGGTELPAESRSMTVTYDAAFGALPTASRTGGYSFQGWYTERDGGVHMTSASQVKLTGDLTLFAHWGYQGGGGGGGGGGGSTPTEYTVTFETNGGTKLASVTAVRGTTLKLAEYTTTRAGYALSGWYLDAAFEKPAGDTLKLTQDVTLYALWKNAPGGWGGVLNTGDHMAYLKGFSDGLAHPCAEITRAEVAEIFYRLMRNDAHAKYDKDTNTFADVAQGAWYGRAVSTLAGMGIVRGRGNARFDPSAPITRGEFAVIAARFSDGEYTGPDRFTDISGHWAAAEINRAAELGWVQGDGSGMFHPGAPITRAEVVTLVNRVLGRHVDADGLLTEAKGFADNAAGAWYYYDILEAANGHTYQMISSREVWLTLAK